MNDFARSWAAGLRKLILKHLRERGPQTTHELANACQVSQAAVAPRMSELLKLGEARDTGRRKSSVSGRGRKLKVWESTERPGCHTNAGVSVTDSQQTGCGGVTAGETAPTEESEPVMRLLA